MKKFRSTAPAESPLPTPDLIPVTSEGPVNARLQELRRSELFACLSAWLGLFGEEFGLIDYHPSVRSVLASLLLPAF